MAHFAKIDENNIVTQVVVVSNEDIIDPHTGNEDEIIGIAFCKKLFGGNWVKTSYNHNIRKRFAGIGYRYDKNLDAFVQPKPYDSWVLNEDSAEWESPSGPEPSLTNEELAEGYRYEWDEDQTQWNLIQVTV